MMESSLLNCFVSGTGDEDPSTSPPVPLDEATLAANAKLQIGTKPPQGGFDKPDVTVKEDSTELVQDKVNLTIDERSFPDPSSGSFEGFAVSNNLGGDVIDFV